MLVFTVSIDSYHSLNTELGVQDPMEIFYYNIPTEKEL
jgi:hypothetical protein